MCALFEKKWLKKLMDQKKRYIISFNVFLHKKIFGYKIILKFSLNASHHYYIMHVLLYQPIYTFITMFSMTWIFIFQKKKEKPK
jgi:hypothetical protein